MGYVMFSLNNKSHLIGMLKSVQVDKNDISYWVIDTRTPIYLDTYGFWDKLEVSDEVRNNGSCYIRITADSEIECEFNEEESIELENGEVRKHGLFQINER